MNYTAVIRTLGKAGKKYQVLLDSLCTQTLQPEAIIVYIAEGYPIPKETCGQEQYVFVKKGMVAQRALSYTEVKTDYILFLDDDLYLPPNLVETMFNKLVKLKADVIAPDIYQHDKCSVFSEIIMALTGRMRARRFDKTFGYKVMATTGFSYNKNLLKNVYASQTNAGAVFFCKRKSFLKIHFEEELWLDKLQYAIGDDQVMFYKMHLQGLKQLTYYRSGIKHLDAGNNLGNKTKERHLVEADYYFRRVFFQRFLLEPEQSRGRRMWKRLCVGYFFTLGKTISLLKGDISMFRQKSLAIRRAEDFINSSEYRQLPKISQK